MSAELSQRAIKELGPGRHRVASNLYLLIDETRRSWVFIYVSPATGKRREMGLGPADLVALARAKELALRHRLAVFEGRDPLEERRAARPVKEDVLTFRQVADLYIGAHQDSWRNPKHRRQWSSTLETYAYPVLGDLAVKAVDTGAVMRVIEGIWHKKPETASRVRGRIEVVLDYATARHWRSQGDNPARWKGHIENLLPQRTKVKAVVHHSAVPWQQLPALWAELADREDISALALRFTLLTAVRTNEALGARWAEVDLERKAWTVPGERMKAGREFRVPLSTAAIAVLDQLAALRQGPHLFPGAKVGHPLSNMAMLMLLRRLRGQGSTVHGMRSSFRDWASEHRIAGEVAEACLAHTIENKTEAAYRRGDLVEPRRAVMERWARFLTTPPAAEARKVVPLHKEEPEPAAG
jgi:integrase